VLKPSLVVVGLIAYVAGHPAHAKQASPTDRQAAATAKPAAKDRARPRTRTRARARLRPGVPLRFPRMRPTAHPSALPHSPADPGNTDPTGRSWLDNTYNPPSELFNQPDAGGPVAPVDPGLEAPTPEAQDFPMTPVFPGPDPSQYALPPQA